MSDVILEEQYIQNIADVIRFKSEASSISKIVFNLPTIFSESESNLMLQIAENNIIYIEYVGLDSVVYSLGMGMTSPTSFVAVTLKGSISEKLANPSTHTGTPTVIAAWNYNEDTKQFELDSEYHSSVIELECLAVLKFKPKIFKEYYSVQKLFDRDIEYKPAELGDAIRAIELGERGVKLFKSVEEMNADPDKKEEDLAIVYGPRDTSYAQYNDAYEERERIIIQKYIMYNAISTENEDTLDIVDKLNRAFLKTLLVEQELHSEMQFTRNFVLWAPNAFDNYNRTGLEVGVSVSNKSMTIVNKCEEYGSGTIVDLYKLVYKTNNNQDYILDKIYAYQDYDEYIEVDKHSVHHIEMRLDVHNEDDRAAALWDMEFGESTAGWNELDAISKMLHVADTMNVDGLYVVKKDSNNQLSYVPEENSFTANSKSVLLDTYFNGKNAQEVGKIGYVGDGNPTYHPLNSEDDFRRIMDAHRKLSTLGLKDGETKVIYKDLKSFGNSYVHNFLRDLKYSSSSAPLVVAQSREVTDFSFLYSWLYNVKYINVGQLYMNSAQSLEGMFYNCNNLKKLTHTGHDGTNCSPTNLSWMFAGCESLERMKLSGRDADNCIYINR